MFHTAQVGLLFMLISSYLFILKYNFLFSIPVEIQITFDLTLCIQINTIQSLTKLSLEAMQTAQHTHRVSCNCAVPFVCNWIVCVHSARPTDLTDKVSHWPALIVGIFCVYV